MPINGYEKVHINSNTRVFFWLLLRDRLRLHLVGLPAGRGFQRKPKTNQRPWLQPEATSKSIFFSIQNSKQVLRCFPSLAVGSSKKLPTTTHYMLVPIRFFLSLINSLSIAHSSLAAAPAPSLTPLWPTTPRHSLSVFYRLPTEGYTRGGKF
jgi:hypothetical protein